MSENLRKEEELPIESVESNRESDPKIKLGRVLELADDLRSAMMEWHNGIAGTEEYTLIDDPIGNSSVENSPMSARQLLFTMALSENPLIENLVKDWESTEFKSGKRLSKEVLSQKFSELAKEKVLKGLKVLDLGCGHEPTFARIARALGADVYTVDQFSSDEFEYYHDEEQKKNIELGVIEKEKENHIKLDLNSKDASKIIKDKTGGDFDLTTEAHLTTGNFYGGKEIGLALLKKGGFHYDPTQYSDLEPDRVVKIKE